MQTYLTNQQLRNAAKDLIEIYYDQLDLNNLPCADDFDNDDLLRLTNICIFIDGSCEFLLECKDSKLIFSELMIAFNSPELIEKAELTLAIQDAAVEYYRPALDKVITHVAQCMYTDYYDDKMYFGDE